METDFLGLRDETEWGAFVEANRDALLEQYDTLADAHTAACQGGVVLGGGAGPMVHVRFMD